MELKNCPFCGGEKITIEGIEVEGITWYRSKCITCFSEGQIFANESETASAWNQRHSAVKVATVDLKPLHDLADEIASELEEKQRLRFPLAAARKLRKALKQMEGLDKEVADE